MQLTNSLLRRRLWLLFSALGLAFLLIVESAAAEEAVSNRPIKDKWAVIIGVSKFANPAIPTLKYSAKDAQDFRDFLVSKGNFSADHVLLLKDEQASRERILDAFGDGWLPKRVMEDDLVVIFISSHGSPADRAGENFIIAYDSNPDHPYSTSIRLQDLASELSKRTGCDRLVLLLDACHSGAAVEGKKGLMRSKTNFDLNAITGTGQLVISSSNPEQVSWESKRYPNGVFTHNLIDALQLNGSGTKINQAYKALKDKVEMEVRFDRTEGQTPMMMSKWQGEDLALCAVPAEPRKIPFAEDLQVLVPPADTPAARRPRTDAATAVRQNGPSISRRDDSARTQIPASTTSDANVGFVDPRREQTLQVPMMTVSWQTSKNDPSLEKGSRLLRPSELDGLSYEQLVNLYNEAYARHGRGFAAQSIQDYFSRQRWYAQDPDYHWRSDDPKVISRGGQTDDPLVVNEKRTPIQWANMQLIKRAMASIREKTRSQGTRR